MKKALFFSLVLSMFLCISAIYASATDGYYTVTCSTCSGSGKITTYEQAYGKCSACRGQKFIHDSSSSKMCFTCGSRSCTYIPGYDYGNVHGSYHYECNSCGSDEVYNGYKCYTCNGAGYCYGTVQTTATCAYCSGSGVVYRICANHTYGSWRNIDSTTHSRTCSRCETVETTNHTWNNGIVTNSANCKQTGTKTYNCTGCYATKTEVIAKTNDHLYSGWIKVNDATHKRTCAVCAKEETANHNWDSGSVTKKATCKEAGVKTYTCINCKATKTETIAKLTTHTYDRACDIDCNVCGLTRTVTHSYKTEWSKDNANHWHECALCKNRKDFAAHTPGAKATETTAQTCTTCGYVIEAALGHTHSYATTWTADDNGHWYACSGCGEKDRYADHTWNEGEVTKEASETEPGIKTYTCSVCNSTKEEELDKLTSASTTESSAPDTSETGPAESAPAKPADTEKDAPAHPEEQAPLWIVFAAVIVVGGGIAAFLIIKKKKN